MIIYIALAGILGGLINRARGGWYADKNEEIPKTILKAITSLFSTCCVYLPFWLWYVPDTNVVDMAWLGYLSTSSIMNDVLWFVGVWLASFAALASGWGSWFSIGREKTSYRHNQDWIVSEWLACKVFGKKWIPSIKAKQEGVKKKGSKYLMLIRFAEDQPLLKRFNYEISPKGPIRPYTWRRNMEKFAMSIRGLNFMIFAPLMFFLHMYFEYDLKLWWLIAFIPTGYIMGYLYEVGYKINLAKFPEWIQGNTHVGEVLAGATIMSSFLMLGSWVALTLS